MVIHNDFHLATKTTMKIGGYCENLYVPENEDELVSLVRDIYREDGRVMILSGGSNLLISDNVRFGRVVSMESACIELTHLGDGRFYVGASVRIQKVISFVNDVGYGGFEELIGLPAMFGGIIYMNAGIGGETNSRFTIGEFVETVRAWDMEKEQIVELASEECKFCHRSSLFHNQKYVILGAVIRCNELNIDEAKRIKDERISFCKRNFEYGKGCFGTCFSKASYKLLKVISRYDALRKLGKGRVTFGEKNKNWLVNHGEGTFNDAIRIINACKKFHKLFRREAKCEIVIWE